MAMTFALFFGNRGFFPGELIADARRDMIEACERNGYGWLAMDESLTRYGGIETLSEGRRYAAFLREHRGKYDGVILCLPNFGDENGAAAALQEADVPILVQAYPDRNGEMDFSHRRDALCGKLAMCNVLRQMGIRYTLTRKFVLSPRDPDFSEELHRFAAICRVVKGMKKVNIGAIGARTTAFKTVRCDEIALQSKRINVETFDLSMVFDRMDRVPAEKTERKKALYKTLADFGCYPPEKLENIARLGVAMDEIIAEYDLHAVAIRCWSEFQTRYGIAPCLVLGELNQRGIAASCEMDLPNAVMMHAVGLAADHPVMLLDVNNNYGSEADKTILFHCGPLPASLMKGKGRIEEHLMFRKSFGEGSGVGINKGECVSGEVTIGSLKTENGKLCSFVTEGKLTEDPIQQEFFGVGKVFQKENADRMLNYMAENGYRHHVCVTRGKWASAVAEAFNRYLGLCADII